MRKLVALLLIILTISPVIAHEEHSEHSNETQTSQDGFASLAEYYPDTGAFAVIVEFIIVGALSIIAVRHYREQSS